MKKQNILLICTLLILLVLPIIPSIFALNISPISTINVTRNIPPWFFTDEHTYWTSQSVINDPGVINSKCADKIQIVVDGNFFADQFVIHYTDTNNVMSYINTHTRLGVDNCFRFAGSDDDLICFCYGMGYHNVQDHPSHVGDFEIQGMVPKYISTRLSNNLIGHMTIEKSFDDQFQDLHDLKNDAQHQQYISNLMVSTILDPSIDPQENKYLELASKIQGSTLTKEQILNDANLITNGFKGTSFYNTVYKTKLQLPIKYEIYSLIPAIFCILILLAFIYLPWLFNIKTNNWKYLLYSILIVISLLSILLFVSFFTGTTWNAVQVAVKIIPIQISSSDMTLYNHEVQELSTEYAKTGKLPAGFDDNSGLTYYKDGIKHIGALNQSELWFYYIALPIILFLFSYLMIWIIFKMFRQKPITTKGLKAFNIIGFIILIISILIISYLTFNFFFFK